MDPPVQGTHESVVGGVGVSAQPVFQPIAHPVLRQLGQTNIRKFLVARDAYVRSIKERQDQENCRILKPVSLKYSLDADLLLSLIDLNQFGDFVDTIDKLNDRGEPGYFVVASRAGG
jgi:hypothetical protein